MKWIAIIIMMCSMSVAIPQQPKPIGKWENTTKDHEETISFGLGGGKLLIVEDYEVLQTHEVCATIYGYFLEKSEHGHYDVSFHGMRTSATFMFTTQYDAEHWVQKWCTPESLTSIKSGRGTFARNY